MPRLVVMRHGRAVPREEAGGDEERWLTPDGRRQVELVARLLPFKPSRVFSSPLRRARETAEIVARIAGGVLVVDEALAPGRAGCETLARLAGDGVVMVGHNPDLEGLLLCLTGGRVRLPAGGYALVKGEWRRGGMSILELVTPGLAERALGVSGRSSR